jgi:hypothetical protein
MCAGFPQSNHLWRHIGRNLRFSDSDIVSLINGLVDSKQLGAIRAAVRSAAIAQRALNTGTLTNGQKPVGDIAGPGSITNIVPGSDQEPAANGTAAPAELRGDRGFIPMTIEAPTAANGTAALAS